MKILKNAPVLSIIAFMLIIPASCTTDGPGTSNEYNEAVEKVVESGWRLTVKHYATGNQRILDKDQPEFDTIIGYLEKSSVTRNQPRFVENEGKTSEVTILYSLGFILEFTLSDGLKAVFDYSEDQFCFNAEGAIYGAATEPGLYNLLEDLVNSVE
jgi:hypothetical protein